MKKTSFTLMLLVLLFSCNKEKKDSTCHSATIEPALVGKWKLIRWRTYGYNQYTCQAGGGNWYNTSDWGTNVMLEVRSEGTFRTYKNDTLVDESFAHKAFVNLSSAGYVLNCQQMNYSFYCLPSESDIKNTEIGDTLIISNPFVDINFFSYPTGTIFSVTVEQYYLKIE